MTPVRRIALLAVSVLLATLAGCGGTAQPGSGAAEVVPAGVPVFVSVDTDFDGEQWTQVEELIRRFPAGAEALDDFLANLATAEDLDFEQDLKPALGPETAFVIAEFDSADNEPPFVVLTQPRDPAKLQEVLEKSSDPTVSEEFEGWTLVSQTQDSIDRFKELAAGGDKLADSDAWSRAMDGLPEDALASAFFDAEALRGALEADPEAQEQLELFFPGGELPAVGVVLRAEENGARVEGRVAFEERPEGLWSPAYAAQLPEEVPDGVLFYVSFNDLEQQFSQFRDALAGSNPEFDRQLAQAEAFLGVSIEEDVAPLFSGEGALYARRGGLIPELTLLLEVEDEQKAVETLDDIVAAVGGFEPQIGEPRDVEIAGVQAREVPLGDAPFSLYYAGFDGRLVVTMSREGIADLREEGDRFSDSETFSEAKDLAGMPDETVGFLYADLQEIIPYILGIAGLSGGDVPPEIEANLEPLQQLIVYGSEEENVLRFAAFLGIAE
jgi:Protein of unknown function (DUF3352)